MAVRGVRGATTVPHNSAERIIEGTREMLSEMVRINKIAVDDIAAATFTVTDDLDAAFPAAAARQLGWCHVPLMDAREIPVPGSLPRCIRVLLLWNTDTTPQNVHHVYLRNATTLRPDLVDQPEQSQGNEGGTK